MSRRDVVIFGFGMALTVTVLFFIRACERQEIHAIESKLVEDRAATWKMDLQTGRIQREYR